jgi:hypothetical protein
VKPAALALLAATAFLSAVLAGVWPGQPVLTRGVGEVRMTRPPDGHPAGPVERTPDPPQRGTTMLQRAFDEPIPAAAATTTHLRRTPHRGASHPRAEVPAVAAAAPGGVAGGRPAPRRAAPPRPL